MNEHAEASASLAQEFRSRLEEMLKDGIVSPTDHYELQQGYVHVASVDSDSLSNHGTGAFDCRYGTVHIKSGCLDAVKKTNIPNHASIYARMPESIRKELKQLIGEVLVLPVPGITEFRMIE